MEEKFYLTQRERNFLKTILILASYSSGSSAITGFFDRCGVHSCPPHFWTNDVKTKISYENIRLKKLIEDLVHLETKPFFQRIGNASEFVKNFSKWYETQKNICGGINKNSMVIKHPLMGFVLEDIAHLLQNACLVILNRPLHEIEASRLRRKWSPVYGKEGAKLIYDKIEYVKNKLNFPYLEISYEQLCNQKKTNEELIKFCDLGTDKRNLKVASDWLRG